jgi:hypothetical protein
LKGEEQASVYVGASEQHAAYSRVLEQDAFASDSVTLRAAEQVRARLVELELLAPEGESTSPLPEPPAKSSTPPAAPSIAPVSAGAPARGVEQDASASRAAPAAVSPPARLWLSAGIAATAATGGLGGTAQAALGLRADPGGRVGFAFDALIPLTENEIQEPEGEGDVLATMLLARLGYAPFELGQSFAFDAGVGGGVLMLTMEGEAQAPALGNTERTLSGLGLIYASGGWVATSWFSLRANVFGGFSAPRPVVRFLEREVATWGRPFVSGVLVAEFGLGLSNGARAP